MKKWLLFLMGISIPLLSAQAQTQPNDSMSVKSSIYISNCDANLTADCTKVIQDACDGYNGCYFLVSDRLCGDPDPNCGKHLTTSYICPEHATYHTVTTKEGDVQPLSCEPVSYGINNKSKLLFHGFARVIR